MKLVAWNCNMALDRKIDLVKALGADVAVIAECANPSREGQLALGRGASSRHWVGTLPIKGLGVFGFGDYAVEPVEESWTEPAFIVPIRVRGPQPFNLLAVWAQSWTGIPGYVRNVQAAMVKYEAFIRSAPTVVAGDFNSSSRWDRPGVPGHEALVAKLDELGLYSAYHGDRGEQHGEELTPSFFMNRKLEKPFHIDYVFLPKPWKQRVRSVEIGAFGQWSPWSDHCPVTVDLE